MGKISPMDKRYELLQKIPKMILKQSGIPFSTPRDMMYIFDIQFTNKFHSIELIVIDFNSRRRKVVVTYRNSRSGICLRRVGLTSILGLSSK